MGQTDLFQVERRRKRVSAQAENLARVGGKIGVDVLAFIRKRGVGGTFHGDELAKSIAKLHQCAPASADRILRLLRREGKCNYSVLSRSKSLYRVESC